MDSPTNEVDEPTNTHGKPTNAQGDSHISRNDVLLAPRWISEVRARGGKGGGTGGTYTVYHGPDGLKANSRAEAWRKHDDAATSKPAPPPSADVEVEAASCVAYLAIGVFVAVLS